MGFNGGGLGKNGNGIRRPITVEHHNGNGKAATNKDKKPAEYKHVTPSTRVQNKVKPWPAGTTLIIGDSILYGIEENKLKRYQAKVRIHPGSCVDDVYDYIAPLLKKIPTNIILHIGSNDSPYKPADDIYNEIMNLKRYIENVLPSVIVYLSCPVIRADDIKANHTLRRLEELLKSHSHIIRGTCLGRKGLHLNGKGSGRLAMNFISLMRHL